MTIQEVFVLNRALDGEQIYGLPTFEKLYISEMMAEHIKEGLVQKSLLATADSFTPQGAQLTGYMKSYKEALKYVAINTVVFGMAAEGRCTAMWHNPVRKRYTFTPVDCDGMEHQISARYPFLTGGEAELAMNGQVQAPAFTESELMKKKNAVTVSTFMGQSQTATKDTFFAEACGLFWYSWKTKTCKITCPTEIVAMLEERLTL